MVLITTKKRNRPFYKQFLNLRKNIQNRPKLFKFKKQKWERFQFYSKKQLRFYKRFKLQDPYNQAVLRFASRGNSIKKKFKKLLHEKKTFSLFYGGLNDSYIKKRMKKINKLKKYKFSKIYNFKYHLLKFFESRLDTVLYRAKFSISIKTARQLIKHGHILINKSKIKTPSFILKTDDLIEIDCNKKSRQLIQQNIDKSNFWPIPPKHLQINYNTLQIIFLYNKDGNLLPNFSFNLNLQIFK